MKKEFSADMKVVRFGAEDVIVTSGAADMVFDSTMGDSVKGNGTVTFNGRSYLMDRYDNAFGLLNAIRDYYGITSKKVNQTKIIGDNSGILRVVLVDECESDYGLGPGYVGSYTYDATSNTFTRQ